jgi:hypothetical protein
LLERGYQRIHADYNFASAKNWAPGAATQAIIAGAGMMVAAPVAIIAAIPAAVCFSLAVKRFGEGIQHAANAVQPDSALRHAVEDLEAQQPNTRIRDVESVGCLVLLR